MCGHYPVTYRTYYLTYNTDATAHLTNINNAIQTWDTYTFTYANNQLMSYPFPSSQYSYPNMTLFCQNRVR